MLTQHSYVMIHLKLYFILFVFGVLGDDLNRCGNIQDDRSVYTNYFDPSNGHTVLDVKITTDSLSGYTWQDVINDRNKWDTFDPWVFCTVSVGGAPPIKCETERRGDWSRESALPSIKVKLVGAEYKGMDRLLLNKHPWDTTRVRNKLSYELLQKIDTMGSLFTQFATLTVNGQYYGIYTLLEELDDHMMDTHGLNKKSNLYKANYVFWSPIRDKEVREVTDPKYNKSKFEKVWDIKGRKNHSLLIKTYNDIYDANVDSRTAILNNFNVKNFATWLAFVYLTSNTDLVFNNFGIYAPVESPSCPWPTPFYFYSWDNDGAWDDHYFDGSIPGVDFPYHEEGMQYFWPLRVVKRFLQVNEFVDLLRSVMYELVSGPLSASSISPLVAQYKVILEPYLLQSPDKENIAWRASISSWKKAMDFLPRIPAEQYKQFDKTILRPMPIYMNMVYSGDKSSLFFFWEKSFILYNQFCLYEFAISTSRTFDTRVATLVTTTTYVTLAATTLNPNTKYYWRVLVRNAYHPENFIDALPALSDEYGFGIKYFTSPSSLSSLSSAPSPHTITHQREVTNSQGNFQYASLDNIEPSLSSSACSNTPLPIPAGWTFAPNSAITRQNIYSLGLPWGGSKLVLADGVRMDPRTGKLIDGFGDFTQHLVETLRADNIKTYSANCTVSANNRILLLKM